MKKPICDFVSKYENENKVRLHMPGHKGKKFLGIEALDITEIDGADSLYEASGIISESEQNASELFGCNTYYSTEGSSLCIRAMMYLVVLYARARGERPFVLAARNAHKTFHSAIALLDIDVEWLDPENVKNYLTCDISAQYLEKIFKNSNRKPTAFYITSPDYLGKVSDIKNISKVCHKYGVLLVVDNAHGAYLRFLDPSQHPIDLGADICCDSAHKTLPVLTGGAYLHISGGVSTELCPYIKDAMLLFGSTSPSYLILQSLDKANEYLESYSARLSSFIERISALKNDLKNHGYVLYGNEPIKITIKTKPFGYYGYELASILNEKGIVCEFSDPDFVVLMLSLENECDFEMITDILLSILQKQAILEDAPSFCSLNRAMNIREACLSPFETVSTDEAINRISSLSSVGCPPAVPIVISGEMIDENAIKCLKYYGIEKINVVK